MAPLPVMLSDMLTTLIW